MKGLIGHGPVQRKGQPLDMRFDTDENYCYLEKSGQMECCTAKKVQQNNAESTVLYLGVC
ncbi:hypothetical protein LBYZC6_41940 [Lacrimispora brassicae]